MIVSPFGGKINASVPPSSGETVGVTMICDSGSGSGGKRRRVSHRSHCKAAATAAEKKNSEQETIVLL